MILRRPVHNFSLNHVQLYPNIYLLACAARGILGRTRASRLQRGLDKSSTLELDLDGWIILLKLRLLCVLESELGFTFDVLHKPRFMVIRTIVILRLIYII